MPAKKATPKRKMKAQLKIQSPKKKILSIKEKKFHLFMINHDTGFTGSALARRFNNKWAPNKVTDRWARKIVTPEAIREFAESGPFDLVTRPMVVIGIGSYIT